LTETLSGNIPSAGSSTDSSNFRGAAQCVLMRLPRGHIRKIAAYGGALIAFSPFASDSMAAPVTFAWDPSPSVVAGYELLYGSEPGLYPTITDAGAATVLSVIMPSGIHYVCAKAYDSSGDRSAPSNVLNVVCDERACSDLGQPITSSTLVQPAEKAEMFIDVYGNLYRVGMDGSGNYKNLQKTLASSGFVFVGGNIEVRADGSYTVVSTSIDGTEQEAFDFDAYGILKGSSHFAVTHGTAWIEGDPLDEVYFAHDFTPLGEMVIFRRNTRTGALRWIVRNLDETIDYNPANASSMETVGNNFTPSDAQIADDGSRCVVSSSGDGTAVHVFLWNYNNALVKKVTLGCPEGTRFGSFARNRDLSVMRISYDYPDGSSLLVSYDPYNFGATGTESLVTPSYSDGRCSLERGPGDTQRQIWFYRSKSLLVTSTIDSSDTVVSKVSYSYADFTSLKLSYVRSALPARYEIMSDGTLYQFAGVATDGACVSSTPYSKPSGYTLVSGPGPEVGYNGQAKAFFVSDNSEVLLGWLVNPYGNVVGQRTLGFYLTPSGDRLAFAGLDTDRNGTTSVVYQNQNDPNNFFVVYFDASNNKTGSRSFSLEPPYEGSSFLRCARNDLGEERFVFLSPSHQGLIMRCDARGNLIDIVPKDLAFDQIIADFRMSPGGSGECMLLTKINGEAKVVILDPVTGSDRYVNPYGPYASEDLRALRLRAGGNSSWGLLWYSYNYGYFKHANLNSDGVKVGSAVVFKPPEGYWVLASLARGGSLLAAAKPDDLIQLPAPVASHFRNAIPEVYRGMETFALLEVGPKYPFKEYEGSGRSSRYNRHRPGHRFCV